MAIRNQSHTRALSLDFVIRRLDASNLGEMLALEALAWPKDVRATEEQFRERLAVFPEGVLGAFVLGKLVGMVSSQIVAFLPDGPLHSWTELTANGWISKTHRQSGNCLHFVSVCVHPERRNQGIATKLNTARLSLAATLGLKYVLSDTRLPGLAAYLADGSKRSAEGYVEAIVAGKVSEPVVSMYLSLGFRPLGLIPDCMQSDIESVNYGLAMLKDIGGGP